MHYFSIGVEGFWDFDWGACLGLRDAVRPALEAFSQQKGNVLVFRPREAGEHENQSQKEKAVSGAVNS
jgi:hypothetical protein